MKGERKKQAERKRSESMKAYSQDLRERVLRAVDQGYPRAAIIKLFGVSRATIKRYLKQRRQTGEVRVKAIPGRPPKKLAPLHAGLKAQLEAHADAT
jgi:transposase